MHIYIYIAVDFYLNKPWLQRLLTFWLKMFIIIIIIIFGTSHILVQMLYK